MEVTSIRFSDTFGRNAYPGQEIGIECNYPGSDNSYLVEVANEQLAECAKGARDRVKELHAELSAFLESVA